MTHPSSTTNPNDGPPATAKPPLPEDLPPGLRELADQCGQVRSYPRHAALMTEGQRAEQQWLFVLVSGCVKFYVRDQKDGRELVFGTLRAPNYFGETMLDGLPRPFSAMATEPCVCVQILREDLLQRLRRDPDLALDILVRMIGHARSAANKVRSLALMDVYGRVASALEDFHGPANGQPVVIYPLTHKELASRVGSSREMVSRLLKELERGGYIALGIKRITLLQKLPPHW